MIIDQKQIIFWDFDGVIKDSVDGKTQAYKALFPFAKKDFLEKLQHHHESNGGMSRYEKIPIYLRWANLSDSKSIINSYAERFAGNVVEAVINSKWVPGVQEFLLENFSSTYFILTTATPESEIKKIIGALGISHCFREVYGFPNKKTEVIAMALKRHNIDPSDALMIGDSENDFFAAQKNSVPFLLRCTPTNINFQNIYSGPRFESLKL